jgi:diguanylate cyclase (GGDEF)-like protein
MNSKSANKIGYLQTHFELPSVKYDFTLMIVDDSDIELQAFTQVLSGLCHIVQHRSAQSAQASIAKGTLPDLILLDANMPDKNGYQMCTELKKHNITAEIPVIMFTSNTDIEHKLKGFQSGCADYLSKPMYNEELYHRVEVYLKHIEKRRELEMLSFIDPITGVANRRTYEYMLQKEWNRCIRYSSKVSLLVVDINNFRNVNNIYGNAVGDECLRRVARILAKFGLRSNDLFARFGGQEFVLMLPGCDIQGSSQIARKMIAMIEQLDLSDVVGSIHDFSGLSISIGIAMEHPQTNNTPAQLFERADDAKFLAKSSGLNRFVAAENPVEFDELTNKAITSSQFSGTRARGQFHKRAGAR